MTSQAGVTSNAFSTQRPSVAKSNRPADGSGTGPSAVTLERDGGGRFFDHDILYASCGELFAMMTTAHTAPSNGSAVSDADCPHDAAARSNRSPVEAGRDFPAHIADHLVDQTLSPVSLLKGPPTERLPWSGLSSKTYRLEPHK